MVVGYLINVYPRPNQTFIRREIAELEGQGITVRRYALRPVDEAVDAADVHERKETRFILESGMFTIVSCALATLLTRPMAALRTLKVALRMGRASHQGVLKHVMYWAEACLLRRWMAEAQVEHLHAHYGTNTAAIAMLSRLIGGPPYSFTAHGPEEFDAPQALSLGEKIKHAAFVVAISEFGRSQLYRWCRHEHWPKINIVRCGVDATFLKAPLTPVPLAPRLLSVGRLAEQKGQLLLMEAAAMLAKRGLEFEIILAGGGEMAGEIEIFIGNHGLANRVKMVGWQDGNQIRDLMLSSRALVMPSFAEGLPVAIMESLALSRPVLSTYLAGIPELVQNNVSGFLVPAGSLDALVTAMAQVLLADPAELSRLGSAGAAEVRLKHDASIEAARLAGFIGESIAREKKEVTHRPISQLSAASMPVEVQHGSSVG